jgi:hypothetical protein
LVFRNRGKIENRKIGPKNWKLDSGNWKEETGNCYVKPVT